ncbi:MAG: hypothetical protein K6D59_03565 [Bacteroidales bacterium]|nr:hypothetical protein [Bacteroidales bacterium]
MAKMLFKLGMHIFNITLSKTDKVSIVVGFILLTIATLCGLRDDGDVETVHVLGFFTAFVQFFFMLWISKCGSNSPSFKYKGTGVSYACMIGEILILLLLILFRNANSEPPFVVYATVALAIMFFSLFAGIKSNQVQRKLFWLTLSGVMLIILILTTVPMILEFTYIHKHNSICVKSLALREKHLQENPALGFMDIQIGDSYSNIKNKLSNDPNVIRIVSTDKKAHDSLMVEWFDATSYVEQHRVDTYERPLSLNRIVKYDVFFNGDTTRVTLGFSSNILKIIKLNIKDCSLYEDKYGEPEVYYKSEVKKYISFGNSYPYYKYLELENDRQWSFPNGVIRQEWHYTISYERYYTISYISSDILDSIGSVIREEQRLEVKTEKEILDSIEQERRHSIIQKEQEKREELERLERLENERIVKEKKRKEALQQI